MAAASPRVAGNMLYLWSARAGDAPAGQCARCRWGPATIWRSRPNDSLLVAGLRGGHRHLGGAFARAAKLHPSGQRGFAVPRPIRPARWSWRWAGRWSCGSTASNRFHRVVRQARRGRFRFAFQRRWGNCCWASMAAGEAAYGWPIGSTPERRVLRRARRRHPRRWRSARMAGGWPPPARTRAVRCVGRGHRQPHRRRRATPTAQVEAIAFSPNGAHDRHRQASWARFASGTCARCTC